MFQHSYWINTFSLLIYNATFIYQMHIHIWVYFWPFRSVPLINLSSHAPASHCFNYYSIIMWSNIGRGLSLFSFFRMVPPPLACLFFHMNFRNSLSASKKYSFLMNLTWKIDELKTNLREAVSHYSKSIMHISTYLNLTLFPQ